MAEEVLVADFLTPGMIEAGRKLLFALDRTDTPPASALWLFLSDSSMWRLLIAWPDAQRTGPRALYERVDKVMGTIPAQDRLPFESITVVGNDAPVIKVLRVALGTGSGVSGTRVSHTAFAGTYIEDAYIYRLS